MTSAGRAQHVEGTAHRFGTQVAFDAINEPGTYICNWSGHLLRVPEEALKPGHSPMLDMIGREPLYVTKISEDPFIPILKARMITADFDLEVNF